MRRTSSKVAGSMSAKMRSRMSLASSALPSFTRCWRTRGRCGNERGASVARARHVEHETGRRIRSTPPSYLTLSPATANEGNQVAVQLSDSPVVLEKAWCRCAPSLHADREGEELARERRPTLQRLHRSQNTQTQTPPASDLASAKRPGRAPRCGGWPPPQWGGRGWGKLGQIPPD